MTSATPRSFAIPLSRPYLPPRAAELVGQVLAERRMGGAGEQTAWCESHLEKVTGTRRALLTNSASSALDATCVLVGLKPGDEVILPSFGFPSAANAVARLGATPVFADIETKRLGLDPACVAAAITPRTRAVMVVHYAGIAADLDGLMAVCAKHDLVLIEDAAQAFNSYFAGRALGTFGALGVFSFQQTKNITSGEGGALLVNEPALVSRAQHLRDKGTNRYEMARGEVPFYEWVELGSGIAPNELTAAVLRAQLEVPGEIKTERLRLFELYSARLAPLVGQGACTVVDATSTPDHNAHSFFLLLPTAEARTRLLRALNEKGIGAATHFVPLHLSAAGRRFGRTAQPCIVTESIAARVLRLPLFVGLTGANIDMICQTIASELTAA